MVYDRVDEGFGEVVESGPQEHHVKHAAGEAHGVVEKSLDIPNGVAVLVLAGLPSFVERIVDQVGHEDAVTQAGEVVDVGGRSIADINDAKARLGLQPLAQCSPAARVAWDSGACEAPNGSGRAAALLLVKPTPNQSRIPLQPG